MIEVREVDGERRLVCVEACEFSYLGFMTVTITANSVGAVVDLEPGTVVDWWASYGITVGKAVIEKSYLCAETGHIEDTAVIINSTIVTRELIIQSRLPMENLTGIRNSVLLSNDHIHVLYSNLQRFNIGDAEAVVIMESSIENSQTAGGNMSLIRSTINNLDVFRKGEPIASHMGDLLTLAKLPTPLVNIVRSTVNNVKVSPKVSSFLAQGSTLIDVELDADVCAFGCSIERCRFEAPLIHMVNCHFIDQSAVSEFPHVTLVDVEIIDANPCRLDMSYSICVGDRRSPVQG